MATGGVPKYLSFLQPGGSATQCIQALCFNPQSPLISEFHKLYYSLFKQPEPHIEIIKALAKKKHGLTRKELLKASKISEGGNSSKVLRELEESDFMPK